MKMTNRPKDQRPLIERTRSKMAAIEDGQFYQPPYRPYSRSNETSRPPNRVWPNIPSDLMIKVPPVKIPVEVPFMDNCVMDNCGDGPCIPAISQCEMDRLLEQIPFEDVQAPPTCPQSPPTCLGPPGSSFMNPLKSSFYWSLDELAEFEAKMQEGMPSARGSGSPRRSDEYAKRYQMMSQNIAYRYPNPGRPREREGAIGGSWRHIKEVLGHHGTQICFVDGLVSLYDKDINRRTPKNSAAFRAALSTPAYAANRYDVETYKKIVDNEAERLAYKPWMSTEQNIQADPDMQPMGHLPPIDKSPLSQTKYKGFYTHRHL